MLKFDKSCWLLRASKPNARQCIDKFSSILTNPTLVISTGFSITSTKIAQMCTTVRLNWLHIQISAQFSITQKQQTQVSECVI